ncbi:MAG TPA: hypothetical protein VJQ09_03355, partial [Candidatus Limnocylindria bacterium]|nr:hypothetical protein [Candidatus Limnocylindria bacterium]
MRAVALRWPVVAFSALLTIELGIAVLGAEFVASRTTTAALASPSLAALDAVERAEPLARGMPYVRDEAPAETAAEP